VDIIEGEAVASLQIVLQGWLEAPIEAVLGVGLEPSVRS
jgi:hypothetical protein